MLGGKPLTILGPVQLVNMITLVTLPAEIHNHIIGRLKYANLTSLRMTCRYMHDLPSHEIREGALRKLEDEFIRAHTKSYLQDS